MSNGEASNVATLSQALWDCTAQLLALRGQLAGYEGLRPEVLAFAQLMEQKLRENDHKGGWQHDSALELFARIPEEAEELRQALQRGPGYGVPYGPRDAAAVKRVGEEAADVANFAMMIADVCGALK